ncbi:hypothetical protein [Streptomyces broussonetiae]|uniref:hypothetical protein n=1 Tax=Streptomyces broussonetiae TaxID=2686304 RepID=UPI002D7E3777|nr:hypothetical protein [Streptomyces broussonetiae]
MRALTRDPQRAALPDGAEVVRFAPDAPAAGFAGATALYLYAQVGTPELLRAAREQGVRHVVLLSSAIIAPGADETHPIHVLHATVEQHLRDSGLT